MTCDASLSLGPSVSIAARRFGSGPMAPVLPNACGWPVARSVARTLAGVSVPPRALATLESTAALAATMGDALDVPPKTPV